MQKQSTPRSLPQAIKAAAIRLVKIPLRPFYRVFQASTRWYERLVERQTALEEKVEGLQVSLGFLNSQLQRGANYRSLQDAEFKVFSQWGEDGIIQYLIQRVPIPNPIFIEFGVEDYRESNTRFLLTHDYWRGLILDGGSAHIDFINNSQYRWRHHIEAVSAFITRENINQLIGDAGIRGDIGLMSIDLDGMDYWVLQAIEIVSPRILILEYNSSFGAEHAVTVPYQPDFSVAQAHYSKLYWGASLAALVQAASQKGYSFVGSNKAGVNAFFVRNDVIGDLPVLTVQQGYVQSRFSNSRDEKGQLNRVFDHREQLKIVGHLPVIDLTQDRMVTIRDLYRLDD